jgi:phosphoribosyl-ATP pyrophosphohydrolase
MATPDKFDLKALEAIILQRLDEDPETSYTARLRAKGIAHVAKKLGEEASETIIAAVAEDRAAVTSEASDLLYHLTVLLALRGVSVGEVQDELARRTGQSGLEEKKKRRL